MSFVIPSPNPILKRKRTVHTFDPHLLVSTMDTNISWWNPNDHNDLFPWRINRSSFFHFGFVSRNYRTIVNSHLKRCDYSQVSSDPPIVEPVLELWGVDSMGNDKIIILGGTTAQVNSLTNYNGVQGDISHQDTQHIAGIRFRLYSPDIIYEVELGIKTVMLWSFLNEEQNAEIPIPLP